MTKHNQSGIAFIETLLVLVIIALVVGTGVYVWHSKKQVDKTLDSANKTSRGTTSVPKESASADSTSRQSYMTIKEWGVKIPLSASLSDAYYVQLDGDETASYMSLDKYKRTDCAADRTSLGLIERFAASDKDDDGITLLSDFPSAVKIDNYYYQYQHPQTACDGRATDDVAGFNEQQATVTLSLMNDFKTASASVIAANWTRQESLPTTGQAGKNSENIEPSDPDQLAIVDHIAAEIH